MVDLCTRGALPFVNVGTHRRVRRSDLDVLLAQRLTREAERSLWLHHAVADRLVLTPDGVMDRAQGNLHRMLLTHPSGMSVAWLARWQEVHNDGVDAVLDTLTSRAPLAIELRQNSPFAGVLAQEQRTALPLSARGLAVTGIDASTAMLNQLGAKPNTRAIHIVTGDFADVAVDPETFSLVFVVFSTFFALSSQAAQVRCFTGVTAALRPGGAFVMEAFVPDPTLFDRGQRVQVDWIDATATRLPASQHDPLTQTIHSRQLLFGPEGMRTFPVDIRYAWPSELDLMARLAGLELTDRWSNWNREPFTATSSYRISIWRRPT